jgi:hypothetical protein
MLCFIKQRRIVGSKTTNHGDFCFERRSTMDYKIWFNQALPHAINRTFKIRFRRSASDQNKTDVRFDCAFPEMTTPLWRSDPHTGPFDDPVLHEELDRLMARILISKAYISAGRKEDRPGCYPPGGSLETTSKAVGVGSSEQ